MATHKKILSWLIKVIISGLLALLILTGFCYFYFNVPVHYACADGATDYYWEPSVFYSRATEGIAYGHTNNEGYQNTYDYTVGMPIDVLILGSSHMEAFEVCQNESAACLLNEKLKERMVYNLGTAGHSFLTCVSNLDAAVSKYHPDAYIVIETYSVQFSEGDLLDAINANVAEIPSHTGGIVGLLQKNQYLRLLYTQLTNFSGGQDNGEADLSFAVQEHQGSSNEDLLDILLQKVSASAGNVGAKPIIMYHSFPKFNEGGQLLLTDDDSAINQFRILCEKNGIVFLDMRERFIEEYRKNYTLPYGFCNTSVGGGHLNKYGHAMIAEELYKLMEGE